MPLVRIDLPRGRTAGEKGEIVQAVQEALHDALGVPVEERFQLITEHEPGGLNIDPSDRGVARSPAAIVIEVTLNHGRDAARKQTFFRAVAAALKAEAGIEPAEVVIGLIEVGREDWSFGNGEARPA